MSQDQRTTNTAGVQVIEAVDEPDRSQGKCSNCCRRTVKFLFSHIGLCGMVIAYSVAGGFIFQHLEETNEKHECIKSSVKYEIIANATTYSLWEISNSFSYDDDDELIRQEYINTLEDFRNAVLSLGYDGTDCDAMGEADGPGYQWSFPGALLFSVTVITTIGYGNIAPKTFWGRLVCIAYATLGIPLMLLCLANIGDVMADIFRFVYTKVCCCGCCRRKEKNKVINLQLTKDGSSPEAWKDEYTNQKSNAESNVARPVILDDDEDDDDDDDDDDKISVPLTITMGVIAGYIFMGAVVFGIWEGWDALKASYFCFVTISTIGFGDVVPGAADFKEVADQWKMVGAAVYMLFGMAILSMCFSLIQEEIVAKFRWIGEKIGILERQTSSEAVSEDFVEEIPAANSEGAPPGPTHPYAGGLQETGLTRRNTNHVATDRMPNGSPRNVKM